MFASHFVHKSLNAATVIAALVWPTVSQSGEFEIISPDETSLEIIEGEIRAHLNPNGCTVGFEAACSIVRQRSEYISTNSYGHGDKVSYSWEIMVPEGFTFNAVGSYLNATRFLNGKEKSTFHFLLDGKIGYDIGRKVCFGPDGFGTWHSIEVRVVWDSTKKKGLKDKTPGEIHVLCDGTEVLSRTGHPNIDKDDEIRIALGLVGPVKLADGDSVAVSFRNLKIETW